MKNQKFIGYLVIVAVAVVLVVAGWLYQNQQAALKVINSFEDCATAGYPIMESYPEQCQTPDGRTFSRVLSQQNEPSDVVREGEVMTVRGTMVCLPHRDQAGPQTMECAFGLLDENDTYYALRDSDPEYGNVSQPMGVPVEVKGTYEAQDDPKYQSIGIITVESISQIGE